MHAVADSAGEIIAAAVYAIRAQMTVSELAGTWARYLTMSEHCGWPPSPSAATRQTVLLRLTGSPGRTTEELTMTSPHEDFWIGSASRQAALAAPTRDLHRAVLRRFLDVGAPPNLSWVREAAAELGLGDSAVAELETADLVHLDGEVVVVAYPFSGRPTRQQVELDGFPAVYAMCAIDALGIPAMAGRDGRISAADPRDDSPVVVSARAGTWTWTPAGAVVVFACAGDCGMDCASWEVMCPNTTFHASRDSAQAYLAARDLDGHILDQPTAVERGKRNFGSLLGGPV